MRRWCAIVVLLGVLGCHRKKSFDARVDDFVKIRDDTCACKDEACTQLQWKLYDAWQMRNDSTDYQKAPDDLKARYMAVYNAFQACVKRSMGGETGTGSDQ